MSASLLSVGLVACGVSLPLAFVPGYFTSDCTGYRTQERRPTSPEPECHLSTTRQEKLFELLPRSLSPMMLRHLSVLGSALSSSQHLQPISRIGAWGEGSTHPSVSLAFEFCVEARSGWSFIDPLSAQELFHFCEV